MTATNNQESPGFSRGEDVKTTMVREVAFAL